MPYKKLWIALGLVLVISFAVLGGVGVKILNNAPPIPAQVVASDGTVLFTGNTIQNGQNNWQSIGGQEVGTIWGHGSYVAPDWSADWLHRECVFILDRWAREYRSRRLCSPGSGATGSFAGALAKHDAAKHIRPSNEYGDNRSCAARSVPSFERILR